MAEILCLDICVEISAPEWFKDPSFIKMLNYNGEEPEKHCRRKAATWHVPGDQPSEYSDVFMVYDGGEGSEREFLSDELWAEIEAVAEKALAGTGKTFCVLWIKNS